MALTKNIVVKLFVMNQRLSAVTISLNFRNYALAAHTFGENNEITVQSLYFQVKISKNTCNL